MRPGARWALAVLAALGAGCAGGAGGSGGAAGGGAEAELPPGAPVILVSIDTLRADRLPAYGYQGVATPALDALARDSILFEHAYTHVPLTLPAHASMLTGLLPPEHGVRDNAGYRLETRDLPFLPRILKRRGYATGAAVSAFVLRAETGMASDFDFYEDEIAFRSWVEMGAVQRPGGVTLDRSLGWLDRAAGGPFFFFFHIYEPHAPYAPPEPYASRYESAYDGEVAAADAILGRLVEHLTELGVYDRSLLILTSDHGEGLGDHGDVEHGPLLYREVLQIPLLLKLPGGKRGGERVAAGAQLVDILPTLLELLDEEPPRELPGRSLLRLAAGDAPDGQEAGAPAGQRSLYSETYFPRLHFGWSELFSLIRYPYHYIHGPDPELYDLAADPGETENLLRRERRVYAELRRELEADLKPFEAPAEVDPETRSKLAALGYVGSAAAPDAGPLPDPKAHIGVIAQVARGHRLFEGGRLTEAVSAFRQVLETEPQMIDVWQYLGHSLLRLERPEESLSAYERSFELSGGDGNAAFLVAGALLKLGRLEEAQSYAELASETQEAAWDLLAQIALRRKDLDAAEGYADKAMATRGTRPGPLVSKAEIELARGRPEAALALTAKAEEELAPGTEPDLYRGLYFVKGRALAELGDAAAAEAAFEREIELFPGTPAPYSHLALVQALQGRAADAGGTLRRLVEANPGPGGYAAAVSALRVLGDATSAERLLAEARRRWPDDPELRKLAAPQGAAAQDGGP